MSCHGLGKNSNVQETALVSEATSNLAMFDALDGSTKGTNSDDDNPFEKLDEASATHHIALSMRTPTLAS